MINAIPLIRILEDDINKHPEQVKEMLKRTLGIALEQKKKKEEKNKRH